jgi:formylglycine-generating enzyme required for sulfatase activity
MKNADDRAWPAGQLRPNELGLFDSLGNAMEWVEDPPFVYDLSATADRENAKYLIVNEQTHRLVRGGSFYIQPVSLRCASRLGNRPGNRDSSFGFRPTRTLQE